MRRQLVKFTLSTLVIVVAVFAVAAAGGFWLLNQGPVSLTFLTKTVQDAMNANLDGMSVSLKDVIIERDAETGKPTFRLRDLALRDASGALLARAPRAAVEVDGTSLLSGDIVVHQLELIGPRLLVQRKRDGSFQLGFDEDGGSESAVAPGSGQSNSGGKSDTEVGSAAGPGEIDGGKLLEFLNRQVLSENADSALSDLQAVRISKASISLFDEANDTVWFAPKANLVFKQTPYGFALFIDASVASGAKPWRTELVVSYRREARRFTVSARVFDLIPADIGDDIFALSQLTQVKIPLSGHAEFELTENGIVTRGSAELSSKSGRIDFPDYVSEPLLIDEGLLRFDYEPQTGDVVIGNSAIFIGGRQAELEGRVQPVRSEDGNLEAVRFVLRGHNVSMDASGDDEAPLSFDQIDFSGLASVNADRLDIDDLILQSGKSGVRLRGRFVGEDGDIGVYLAGRVRDLPETMVKKLWPPVVAAGALRWIDANVERANVKDGTFQLNIPGKVLARALRDKVNLPDNTVDASFTLEGVDTRYFRELPAIRGASGEGRLTGDNFKLHLAKGTVSLPSGASLEFVDGTMTATNLVPPLTPAVIKVKGRGKASAFMELLDHKPLGLVSKSKFDTSRLSGDGTVDIAFDIPMQPGLTGDQVKISASAKLNNATFKNVAKGMDITSGTFKLGFGDAEITATGPARIDGNPVKMAWTRKLAKNGADSDRIVVQTTLGDERRRKLGIDVSEYLSGPVPMEITAQTREGKISSVSVAADLSKVAMRFGHIQWARRPVKGTKATFDVDFSNPQRTAIRKLALSGKGVEIKGELELSADGTMMEANFPTVLLNEENHFALGLQRRNDNLALAVTGKVFDARPLIKSMFSSSSANAPGPGKSAPPTAIDVSIARVYANRGEVITGLKGQLQVVGGIVRQSNLQGNFLNGAPITLRITPGAGGNREMRLTGRDGGGTLRAVNLYSKISGGSIDFQAIMGSGPSGSIKRGLLILRNFEVRNEVVLDDINKKSKSKTGPRRQSLKFSKLELPFSTDRQYVRIGDALIRSPELGASAQGIIRKADGAMNIGGTIIPAYALNAALGEVPIFGQLLVGGRGQGVFGLNFALQGSMNKPKFVVNPVSAIAPGFLRRFFDIGGGGVAADGTPRKRKPNAGGAKIDQ